MAAAWRLATRGSPLAVAQSQQVADAVTAATGVAVVLVTVTTRGDRVTDRPLGQVGGKGLFTREVEDAVLRGEADFAVHSAKDLPTERPDGLVLGAVPLRQDPRDVLIGATLAGLRQGAVVGTGSLRRQRQLLALRDDLRFVDVRGNIDTRLAKAARGDVDAIVLAAAGLNRLGVKLGEHELLSVTDCLPAVGQGALAVECRADDAQVRAGLAAIEDASTRLRLEVERAFLIALSGGCSVPAACHAVFEADGWVTVAGWHDGVGAERWHGPPGDAVAAGAAIGAALR
ncbi:MAG: hydroxymethylbilane synthase [Pseudomonadota bacterium]